MRTFAGLVISVGLQAQRIYHGSLRAGMESLPRSIAHNPSTFDQYLTKALLIPRVTIGSALPLNRLVRQKSSLLEQSLVARIFNL
jgi:hypothetical protein